MFFFFILLKVEVKPSVEVAAESEEDSEESEESEEDTDSDDEEEESDSDEESDEEDTKTETVWERIEVWSPWHDMLPISTENPWEKMAMRVGNLDKIPQRQVFVKIQFIGHGLNLVNI